MIGQSSATPFMKASHDKSKKSEQGVSFGALETKDIIDKHSSSIDKLTSLVKLERQETQYRPMVYQNRGRGCPQSPIVEIGINPTGVEKISSTITEVIGPTIGIEVDQ